MEMNACKHTLNRYSYKNKYMVTEGTGLITKSFLARALERFLKRLKIKGSINKNTPVRNFTSFATPKLENGWSHRT